MSAPVNIGLDFGSLGWRAACYLDGEVVRIPLAAEWNDAARWMSCEAEPGEVLGVRFPTVKSSLGPLPRRRLDGTPDAREIVRRALAELHRQVKECTGRTPAGIVITVPAVYTSSRREALHELAYAARFTDVHLLNDSVAAVIAHAPQRDETATFLVLGMGYSGFEAALIRAAKNKLVVLGYDGAAAPCGATFDTLIMHSFLRALAQSPFWSPTLFMAPFDWVALRCLAERLKEMAADYERPRQRLALSALGKQRIEVALPAHQFAHDILPFLDSALKAAERLIQSAAVTPSELTDVLLVGGSSSIKQFQHLTATQFGRPPVLLPAEAIMRGAALYANEASLLTEVGAMSSRAEGMAAEPMPAPLSMGVSLSYNLAQGDGGAASPHQHATDSHYSSGVRPAPQTDTLSPAGDSIPAVPDASDNTVDLTLANTSRQSLFEYVHRLIGGGSYAHAAELLTGIINDAQALLASLPAPSPAAKLNNEVELLMRQADDLLASRQFQEAVTVSHEAYALAGDDLVAFLKMINIHCRAAAAFDTLAGYPTAMQWLMCAYTHDRTNSAVHERIAERHFTHARQLADKAERESALKALEQCLTFKPDHAEAGKLRALLVSNG
ncbi:MAG: Hsp70 family protein [Pyrinomonadaceae bacterium]